MKLFQQFKNTFFSKRDVSNISSNEKVLTGTLEDFDSEDVVYTKDVLDSVFKKYGFDANDTQNKVVNSTNSNNSTTNNTTTNTTQSNTTSSGNNSDGNLSQYSRDIPLPSNNDDSTTGQTLVQKREFTAPPMPSTLSEKIYAQREASGAAPVASEFENNQFKFSQMEKRRKEWIHSKESSSKSKDRGMSI